jgi:cell division protein FtsI (penicillin-binding protein 3)
MQTLQIDYADSANKNDWGRLYTGKNSQPVLNRESLNKLLMPDLKGMGLKDALFLLESMNMKVASKGKGKVKMQSIEPGTSLMGIQNVKLELN